MAGIIGVLYAWRGGASLLFLLIAVGVIMVGGLIVQLSGPRAIKIERTITPVRPIAGSTLLVKVRVNFSARLPLPWLTIADFWRDRGHHKLLFPGFRRSFEYTYLLENMPRGHHHLQGCRVTWGDLPGWFTGRSEPAEEHSVKVLPAPYIMAEQSRIAALLAVIRSIPEGEEAAMMRPWNRGNMSPVIRLAEFIGRTAPG